MWTGRHDGGGGGIMQQTYSRSLRMARVSALPSLYRVCAKHSAKPSEAHAKSRSSGRGQWDVDPIDL